MTENDIHAADVKLPTIAQVQCADGKRRIVTIKWGEGSREGRTERIDLSPLIDQFRLYHPLRNDPALFATVHAINGGSAPAWGNANEIDMAAASVKRLAESTEQ